MSVLCDQHLARRLEGAEGRSNAAFADARARAFPETGAEWTQVEGAWAVFDGVDSPCTQTFGLGLFESPTRKGLSELEDFFHELGANVFHEVSPLADLSLLNLLHERGYRATEMSNVLFQPVEPPPERPPGPADEIRVRRVESGEEGLWASTAALGWMDVAPEFEDFFLDLGKVTAEQPDSHCFVAEKGDEQIAAAAMNLSRGVAVLAGASTVAKWRKQGAQSALLTHRLRFAVEHGCDVAMVVAQPGSASQRNAERRGFRVAYTRTKWHLASGAIPSGGRPSGAS